jgi:hypothetical protein
MHINPFFSLEILSIHSQMELHRTTGRLSATVAHLSVTNNNLVGTLYPFSLILKQISTSTWVFIWNEDWLLTTLDLLPRNGRRQTLFSCETTHWRTFMASCGTNTRQAISDASKLCVASARFRASQDSIRKRHEKSEIASLFLTF